MHSYYDDNSKDLPCPRPDGGIEIILAENQLAQEQLNEIAELQAS